MYVTHARILVHAFRCTYRCHVRHRLYCARTQQQLLERGQFSGLLPLFDALITFIDDASDAFGF
jgi:hypothetical protein